MQTVAKIAAIVAGLGLIAMSFAAFTPQAGAQSPSIQAQINALLAQVERLQAQLNALQGGTSFTRDLTIGSSGADVTRLQQFLISRGHAIPAGATGYFGVQTRAAVAAYQSANAIAPTAGYFGPLTRTSVNAKLVVVLPPSNGNDDKDEDDDNDNLSGGEALLGGVRLEEGDDDEVEIGGNGEVAVLTFDVEDGDVRVNRLDLSFMAASGNDEDEPWNAFTKVTLYDADGHRIAREDVSDEDDWLENDDEPYTFRFSNLGYIVREDDEAEITVEVGVSGDAEDGDRWLLSVEDDGIEAVDSTGGRLTTDGSGEVSFDIADEKGDSVEDDADVVRTSAHSEQRSGADNDYAMFEIELTLTANDDDIYLSQDPNESFVYQIQGSGGSEISGSDSLSDYLRSDADTVGGYYVIREGDSETFTLEVTFDPKAADEGQFFRLKLESIRFADSASSPDVAWNLGSSSRYQTDRVMIYD